MKLPGFKFRIAFAVSVIAASAAWLMRPLDRSVLIPVSFQLGSANYVNAQGRLVFPENWTYATEFSGDTAEVHDHYSRHFQLHRSGELVRLDRPPSDDRDVARAELPGVYGTNISPRIRGYADSTGKLLYPLRWDLIAEDVNLVPVRQGPLWGYQDRSGNWGINPRYESAEMIGDDGTARVSREGKFGIVNNQGQEIVGTRWDQLPGFYGGEFTTAALNDKCGLVNRNGEIAVPMVWDLIYHPPGSPLAGVVAGDKYGAVDTSGRIVVSCDYEHLEIVADGPVYFVQATNDVEGYWGSRNQLINRFYQLIGNVRWTEPSVWLYDARGKVIWCNTWLFSSWAWVWIAVSSAWVAIEMLTPLIRRIRSSHSTVK